PVGLLTVVLIAGTGVRLSLLFLRPTAKERFRQPRRRLLAPRAEQGGDVLLLFTAACMVLFGYGHKPSALLVTFWLLCLLGGLALVRVAHEVARRYRPEPGPRVPTGSGAGPSLRPPTPRGGGRR
ncbi:MAG: hypothetical protein JWM05_49, partial [Acidimicrobiales bacterium]|nr:hypothetical protein [Acidimicrobiales bacterium]